MTEDLAIANGTLTRADLVPGTQITITPNKRIYDRSYTSYILEVIENNGASVAVRKIWPLPRDRYEKKPIILLIAEHDFYPANNLYALISAVDNA